MVGVISLMTWNRSEYAEDGWREKLEELYETATNSHACILAMPYMFIRVRLQKSLFYCPHSETGYLFSPFPFSLKQALGPGALGHRYSAAYPSRPHASHLS